MSQHNLYLKGNGLQWITPVMYQKFMEMMASAKPETINKNIILIGTEDSSTFLDFLHIGYQNNDCLITNNILSLNKNIVPKNPANVLRINLFESPYLSEIIKQIGIYLFDTEPSNNIDFDDVVFSIPNIKDNHTYDYIVHLLTTLYPQFNTDVVREKLNTFINEYIDILFHYPQNHALNERIR